MFAAYLARAQQVALISTMGTETPEDPKSKYFMDYISFYKLNFEAELMSSGIPFTIVKPCGLDYSGTEPGKKESAKAIPIDSRLSAGSLGSAMAVSIPPHPGVSGNQVWWCRKA